MDGTAAGTVLTNTATVGATTLGGGVFVSSDGGATWRDVPPLTREHLLDIDTLDAFDPSVRIGRDLVDGTVATVTMNRPGSGLLSTERRSLETRAFSLSTDRMTPL